MTDLVLSNVDLSGGLANNGDADGSNAAAIPKSHGRLLFYYALRRLALIPPGVFILVAVSFFLTNLVPSDPGREFLGGTATIAQVHDYDVKIGFTGPILTRFWDYIVQLAHGNLGTSYLSQQSVNSAITLHLPNTVELIIPALFLALIFGTGLGWLAAHVRTKRGAIANFAITILQSVPEFVFAVLLIYVLFSRANIVPAPTGQLGFADTQPTTYTGMLFVDALISGDFSLLSSIFMHALLPVLTLALALTPFFSRIIRAGLVRALDAPYVEFGKANGLGQLARLGYVLRDVRSNVLTYFAILLAGLVGGAAIVETIFSWNGIGQWAVTSVISFDLPSVEGFILVTTTLALVIFQLLDVILAWLDPRIELVRSK